MIFSEKYDKNHKISIESDYDIPKLHLKHLTLDYPSIRISCVKMIERFMKKIYTNSKNTLESIFFNENSKQNYAIHLISLALE